MDWTWITTTPTAVMMSVASAVGIYLALVLYTRLAGLRSFSKMSSFDFAMTVAIGSLIATTILTRDPPLLQAVVALAALYLIQMVVARWRIGSRTVRNLVDNEPLLIMKGDQMLEDAMKEARITRADLVAKLREANVLRLDQVRAVVMETTGDVSVLHVGSEDRGRLDEELLNGVRGVDRIDFEADG